MSTIILKAASKQLAAELLQVIVLEGLRILDRQLEAVVKQKERKRR